MGVVELYRNDFEKLLVKQDKKELYILKSHQFY